MKCQTFFYFTTILSVVKCLVDDKGQSDQYDELDGYYTSAVDDSVNHRTCTSSSSTSEITHSIDDRQASSSFSHFPIIPSLLFTVLVL